MAEYELTRGDKHFVEGYRHFFQTEVEAITPEYMGERNAGQIKRKYVKKYLLESGDAITTRTFVLPVSEGAITAYYFENTNILEEEGLSPLIIFFHGGGWIYGNMEFYSIFLRHLSESVGADVLLFDYRLAPKHKFPIAVEDCYDAYLWAASGAKYWKVDPDRIFLAGDEAGANLAAVVTMLARDRKAFLPAGQILLYPITDCRLRTQSITEHRASPTLNEKMLNFYVKNYQREPKDILSPTFSPLLSKDMTRLPPALIIAGDRDPLLDDARLYAEALKAGDSKSLMLTVPGGMNGFMPFKDGMGRRRSEGAIWQFIQGRNLDSIQLMTMKDLKKLKKKHSKTGAF